MLNLAGTPEQINTVEKSTNVENEYTSSHINCYSITKLEVPTLEGLALQLGSVFSDTTRLLLQIMVKYCCGFGCSSRSDWEKHKNKQTVYYQSHDKLARKKTVWSTERFVSGTKSEFIDTTTTVNKFSITEKKGLICQLICLLDFITKKVLTEAFLPTSNQSSQIKSKFPLVRMVISTFWKLLSSNFWDLIICLWDYIDNIKDLWLQSLEPSSGALPIWSRTGNALP